MSSCSLNTSSSAPSTTSQVSVSQFARDFWLPGLRNMYRMNMLKDRNLLACQLAQSEKQQASADLWERARGIARFIVCKEALAIFEACTKTDKVFFNKYDEHEIARNTLAMEESRKKQNSASNTTTTNSSSSSAASSSASSSSTSSSSSKEPTPK